MFAILLMLITCRLVQGCIWAMPEAPKREAAPSLLSTLHAADQY